MLLSAFLLSLKTHLHPTTFFPCGPVGVRPCLLHCLRIAFHLLDHGGNNFLVPYEVSPLTAVCVIVLVFCIRKNQLFLLHLITSYSSYFGGKKGISGNKTSFFLLMCEVRVVLSGGSLSGLNSLNGSRGFPESC